MAWLLQNGQEEQVWGQDLSSDTKPVLTTDSSKKVCKVTYQADGQEFDAKYTKSGGHVILPSSNPIPSNENFVFADWYYNTEEYGPRSFDRRMGITSDTTVYAEWKLGNIGPTTETNPYLIPDYDTLKAFRNYVNAGNDCEGMYFKVTNNIVLEDQEETQWIPIGDNFQYNHIFKGHFDCNGKTISGLYINTRSTNDQGLFGCTQAAAIKNLTVSGSVSSLQRAGGIVGHLDMVSTMENCVNNCNVSTIMGYAGGIVGSCAGGSQITGCQNNGSISSRDTGAGGIVGHFDGFLLPDSDAGVSGVTDCYNTGKINGYNAGGIAGEEYGGSAVTNCYNVGTVTGSDAGAIVGQDSIEVTNSYYLDTSCDSEVPGGTAKNETEFNSGEVTWLLQNGRTSQVWGQIVGAGYPELTGEAAKKVCKVTFMANDVEYEVEYANPTGLAELPADPVKSGYTFEGWSTEQGGFADFDGSAAISADTTVYAVFTQLRPGTGTVKMADYTCGDNSVEPVAESTTNTGEVTITYKQKDAPDNEYTSDKPTTAGEYTVRAVFAATNDYNEVTATADFRITHKLPSSVNGAVMCGCNSELRLEAEPLTEVPDGLSELYSDVGTLTRALAEQVDTGTNYAVYDVKIEVKEGGEAWQDAPENSIPDSVTVTLPYPAGTNSGYTFTVVHMLASGASAGQTETPDVTNGADGLTVTLNGLSPVCVGWTAPSSVSYPAYFSVAVPSDFEGGNVTSSRTSAMQGSRVTLTVKPDEGYHFGSLTVRNRYGKPVEVTAGEDGTYTFTMPYGQVTVEAAFVKCGSLSFTDLNAGAWYHDYTDHVIAQGLMRGIGGGLFAPDGAVSRAQMVTVLWNMRGKPVVNYNMTYSDVSEEAWYAEAVRWATSEGIAGGYGDGRFGPGDPITREQMAVMLYRYEQKYDSGGFIGDWMYRLPFTDLDQISDWAFEAVAWCNMKGVITGKDDNIFDPKGPAKRGELAAILTCYCGEETGEE